MRSILTAASLALGLSFSGAAVAAPVAFDPALIVRGGVETVQFYEAPPRRTVRREFFVDDGPVRRRVIERDRYRSSDRGEVCRVTRIRRIDPVTGDVVVRRVRQCY